MPDLSLPLLVLRAQGHDRAAWEELIHLHHPRLRAFLHKMLPARNNIDDLAQDVWLDVFRALPTLVDPASFLPWLFRIARNRAYRTLRLRTPAPTSLDSVDLPADADDEEPFTPEDATAVHAALDRLPPDLREILLLRFMADLSYDDIAAATSCPLGTVRSRIHNAKRQLRTLIEKDQRP